MEIKKTKKISALFFALFLLLSVVSLGAWDFPEPSFTVGSGLVVDIAPFGVEQFLQCGLRFDRDWRGFV